MRGTRGSVAAVAVEEGRHPPAQFRVILEQDGNAG
jgi:hypothetical protein